MKPLVTETYIEVLPHHNEKKPGFNVIAVRIIRHEDSGQEVEAKVVLNRFRRVKSNQDHRRREANDYAASVARIFGVMDVRPY